MNAEILTREKTGEAVDATTGDPGRVAAHLPENTGAETTVLAIANAAAADRLPEEATDETATAGGPGAEAGNTGGEDGPLRMILLPPPLTPRGHRLMFPQGPPPGPHPQSAPRS